MEKNNICLTAGDTAAAIEPDFRDGADACARDTGFCKAVCPGETAEKYAAQTDCPWAGQTVLRGDPSH